MNITTCQTYKENLYDLPYHAVFRRIYGWKNYFFFLRYWQILFFLYLTEIIPRRPKIRGTVVWSNKGMQARKIDDDSRAMMTSWTPFISRKQREILVFSSEFIFLFTDVTSPFINKGKCEETLQPNLFVGRGFSAICRERSHRNGLLYALVFDRGLNINLPLSLIIQ